MPRISCLKSLLATVSGELTVIVSDFGKPNEQFFSFETFHNKIERAFESVDDEFKDSDDVFIVEMNQVLEFVADAVDGFLVATADYFDGEDVVGLFLDAPFDCPDGSLFTLPLL